MYLVVDFYENPFGEVLCVAKSVEDAREFCTQFALDTDGECHLKIVPAKHKKSLP